ncbi:MAG TPA: biopolymer transporter ExbD [Candidatus Deferrimicrobiaceae bacterium]
MKYRRHHRGEPEEIPITNLVDVLFLLIVFFMVSTVLSFDKGIGVKLPETGAPGRISTKGVSILVDREGKVFVDGRPVPLDALGEAVSDRRKVSGGNVILRSDQDTRYQAIADVMDRLIAAGISDISLPVVERVAGR